MQKSKLGISVGLLGAAIFFVCFFGGYTAAVILAGYILLFEENAWLKRIAVKGVVLMIALATLSAAIYLLPNVITLIDSIATVFGGHVYIAFISNIIRVIDAGLVILEKIAFIILGFKALKVRTIRIPVIDALVDKYMD